MRVGFCVFLALAATVHAGVPLRSHAEHVHFPGGIADPALTTAYLRGRSGSVECIDLATGKTTWTAPEAIEPVLLTKDDVVAVTGGPTDVTGDALVFLKRTDGTVRLRSGKVGIIGRGDGSSGSIDLRVDGARIVFKFVGSTFYNGGAAPHPGMVLSTSADSYGTLDPATGAITPDPAVKAAWEARAHAPVVANPRPANTGAQTDIGPSPFFVEDRLVCIWPQIKDKSMDIVWCARDTAGQLHGPEALDKSRRGYSALVSSDYRHMVLRLDVDGTHYTQTLYSMITGKKLIDIPGMPTGDFSGRGKRLYFRTRDEGGTRPFVGKTRVINNTLTAHDLTLNTIWSRPIFGEVWFEPRP